MELRDERDGEVEAVASLHDALLLALVAGLTEVACRFGVLDDLVDHRAARRDVVGVQFGEQPLGLQHRHRLRNEDGPELRYPNCKLQEYRDIIRWWVNSLSPRPRIRSCRIDYLN